jgi:hypothetical protein
LFDADDGHVAAVERFAVGGQFVVEFAAAEQDSGDLRGVHGGVGDDFVKLAGGELAER